MAPVIIVLAVLLIAAVAGMFRFGPQDYFSVESVKIHEAPSVAG